MDEYPNIRDPVVVQLKNYIMIIGSSNFYRKDDELDMDIWMYNIYIERWRKYAIPDHKDVPPRTRHACAVAVGTDIYKFGGFQDGRNAWGVTNALWKLTTSPEGCFNWGAVTFQRNSKLPSPRQCSSAWEYANCLWVFGGYDIDKNGSPRPLAKYLNSHGIFQPGFGVTFNNQLLCYDPSDHLWMNPQCFGEVPSPRESHGTSIIRHKVWLIGGNDSEMNILEDFFELNMISRTWTKIQTGHPRPQVRIPFFSTLSENQLLLHAGGEKNPRTWIMDLPSQTWKMIKLIKPKKVCPASTAFIGINRCIILIKAAMPTSCVRLEPKSLQQLASQTIYKHSSELSWQCLPSKMIAQFEFSLSVPQLSHDIKCKSSGSATAQ